MSLGLGCSLRLSDTSTGLRWCPGFMGVALYFSTPTENQKDRTVKSHQGYFHSLSIVAVRFVLWVTANNATGWFPAIHPTVQLPMPGLRLSLRSLPKEKQAQLVQEMEVGKNHWDLGINPLHQTPQNTIVGWILDGC